MSTSSSGEMSMGAPVRMYRSWWKISSRPAYSMPLRTPSVANKRHKPNLHKRPTKRCGELRTEFAQQHSALLKSTCRHTMMSQCIVEIHIEASISKGTGQT
eukprot:3471401-Amphidinium_carterae.3